MARLRLRPGECFACGCTDDYGCESGCSWVDGEHTMCSRCEQLALLYSRWLGLTGASLARGALRRAKAKASGKRKEVTRG